MISGVRYSNGLTLDVELDHRLSWARFVLCPTGEVVQVVHIRYIKQVKHQL